MLLQKIILNNFRQFYGKQEIEFSTNTEKNVTLIHAENGVGKTTLLNAILWCFYEKTTGKFENPDKIVCNQAIDEGNFEAAVEVYFEHDGKDYFVSRSINEKFEEHTFEASNIVSGNYERLPEPKVFVDSVIPREMSGYFFFDGEYAETFASNSNKKAVQTAVESMLGCNLAIQASKDFSAIAKQLDKKISALTKNNSAASFQSQIDHFERDDESDRKQLAEIEHKLERLTSTKEDIQKRLRNIKGAKEVEQRREELKLERASKIDERDLLDSRETKWIHQYSIGFFADKARKECLDVIEQANLKGHIPSKIADTFVNGILESGTCICGREFSEHSSEEQAIRNLIKEAGTSTMSDRLLSVRGLIGVLDKSESSALSIYQEISNDRATLESRVNDIELEIKRCDVELRGSEVKEIAERQSALDQCEQEIGQLLQQKGRLEKACEDREGQIIDKKGKRDKILAKNDEASLLQKQVALLQATKIKLEEELETYRAVSRETIGQSVDEILAVAARRSYSSRIDENFNLNMYYSDTDIPVAKSSGENQLLSLAFISSLIKFAADRRGDEQNLLKPGTMAPLMLDSPFGQLDPSYRRSTSEFLPKLAGQVILLLTKTQGDEEVLKVLRQYIQKEYVLVSEVVTEKGDKPVDIITLNGEQLKASVYGAEKNQTRVQKVL
jgi:DNA repair exonuclease SbcCD ATPase subunit